MFTTFELQVQHSNLSNIFLTVSKKYSARIGLNAFGEYPFEKGLRDVYKQLEGICVCFFLISHSSS